MKVFLAAAMLVLLQSAFGQSMVNICSSADISNGANIYFPHDTDCDKFVQCLYNANGEPVSQVRQCAFPLYWNNNLLTCDNIDKTACAVNMCQNDTDGMSYKGEGNCRGYWSCMNNEAQPKCCPQGQKYTNATAGCVDTDELDDCMDTCIDDVIMAENDTKVEEIQCNRTAIEDQPSKYAHHVEGFADPFTMDCAPGTVFNQTACDCTVPAEVVVPTSECKPVIYLPFDGSEKDQSGQNNYVTNTDVTFENGLATFNGFSSKLILPRINNVDGIHTLVIKINYTSDHSRPGMARAIISNSGENCNMIPSILLSEDSNNIYFGVRTTGQSFQFTYVAHEEMTEVGKPTKKSLVYKFDANKLYGSNGLNSTEVNTTDTLKNVHCNLNVGYARDLAPFDGKLDDLKIYLCDPDM